VSPFSALAPVILALPSALSVTLPFVVPSVALRVASLTVTSAVALARIPFTKGEPIPSVSSEMLLAVSAEPALRAIFTSDLIIRSPWTVATTDVTGSLGQSELSEMSELLWIVTPC